MDDKVKGAGGKREGSGRKSKAEEQKLIENLTPLNPLALANLKEGLESKSTWATKMFFEYFYGKPQQRVDVTTNDENINLPIVSFFETE